MSITDSTNDGGSDELPDPRIDFYRFESTRSWNLIYERLKNICSLSHKQSSTDVSRQVENRWKNRYRDIIPFDNTRVVLDDCTIVGDYINANHVQLCDVSGRKYILTQGPLKQTTSHFWLMVWENNSPLIVMLNRLIEKGNLKCHPYFPSTEEATAIESKPWLFLDDVNLQVCLEEEHDLDDGCTKRVFSLVHSKTDERRLVVHMNYLLWPDFGVPSTPSGMLNFLWLVRNTGLLCEPDKPAIIHCSAGVGRSGAFVLIDLALCLVEQRGTMEGLDLCQLFSELRSCRMGIIQTAEQLRFCYTAVIQAAEAILACPAEDIPLLKFESHSDDQTEEANAIDTSSDEDEVVDEEVEEDWDAVKEVELVETEDLNQYDKRLPIISSVNTTSSELTNRLMQNRVLSDRPRRAQNSWMSAIGIPDAEDPNDGFGMNQTDERFSRTANLNSSNNALLVNATDPSEMELRHRYSENTEQSSTLANSQSLSGPSSGAVLLTQPHGDGLTASSLLNPVEVLTPLDSEDISNEGEMESFATEYMAVTHDLQRRRFVRQQRQQRLRDRIEEIRTRMREADMQRTRWIPQRLLYYLRRFYTESGWINTPAQAVLTTAIVLCAALGFTVFAYKYVTR